jgi:hypothetical protein
MNNLLLLFLKWIRCLWTWLRRRGLVEVASAVQIHSIRINELLLLEGPIPGMMFNEFAFGYRLTIPIRAGQSCSIDVENITK